jgi:16S rRNA (guanine527-N7)-methyltransferase
MHPARIAELLGPFLAPADERPTAGDERPASNDQRLTTNDELTPDDSDKVSTYLDLLLRWNARINLTAIRDAEQIIPRHFGESFFLARHLFPNRQITGRHPERIEVSKASRTSRRTPAPTPTASSRSELGDRQRPLAAGHWPLTTILDIGSGAGFPALPLKIWAPEIHLTMIEANHKKAAFLREVVRALQLTDVDVIAERAETLFSTIGSSAPALRMGTPCPSDSPVSVDPATQSPPPSQPVADPPTPDRTLRPASPASPPVPFPADIVTFRAVERFDRILPLAARFLNPHGQLAILIGSTQLEALPTAGLAWSTMHIPQSQTRLLAVGVRVQKSGVKT